MAFLGIPKEDMENVQEPQPVDTEEEVVVEINEIKEGIDKNGMDYMLVFFSLPEHDNTPVFNKFYSVPNEKLKAHDEDKYKAAILHGKRLCNAFGMDYSEGVEPDSMVGLQAWAFVGVDMQENTEFDPKNYIKKFIGPTEG